MKRSFFLFAVILGACVIGTTARAQFTTNPMVTVTTNYTALTPIGNGFGVALLGYGMPEYNPPAPSGNSSNYLFFATPMGQPSASDATVTNGVYQFYVVSTDKDAQYYDPDGDRTDPYTTSSHSDLVAFKVSSPLSSPTSLTVVRTWIACVETNYTSVAQAHKLGACGVTKSGTIALRAAAGNETYPGYWGGQGIYLFDATSNTTTVITNVIGNFALDSNCIITQSSGNAFSTTLSLASMGRNQGLVIGTSFGDTQYVARTDITGTGNLGPHAQLIATDSSRGIPTINDTARVLAYWKKTPDEIALSESDVCSASDACTHLAVFYYNDAGGSITLDTSRGDGTGSNVWAFGHRDGDNLLDSKIDTNAIDYFCRAFTDGPAQVSINDNGELAFPVSINCYVGNISSNGTRSADVTGILFKDANTGTFRKVVDNTDSNLFLQIPVVGTRWDSATNNLFSPPVLDNRGNVFFEAAYTNTVIGGTNYYSATDISNAVFQSVPNQYPNPTSWTTRILLHEGQTFVEPTSGQTNMIIRLPLASGGNCGRFNVPRSLGANSINRTPVPGSTSSLGGVIVCATLSNLTAGLQYDGVLYVAPISMPQVRITSITRSGNDLKLVWNGWAGSNVVQVANGGNFVTNNFVDLASIWLSTPQVTNYTHPGGAVGTPNRYYRIRLLVP